MNTTHCEWAIISTILNKPRVNHSWKRLVETLNGDTTEWHSWQLTVVTDCDCVMILWDLFDSVDLRPRPMAPSSPVDDLSSPSDVSDGMTASRTLTTRRCSAPKSTWRRHSSTILNHHRTSFDSLPALHSNTHTEPGQCTEVSK